MPDDTIGYLALRFFDTGQPAGFIVTPNRQVVEAWKEDHKSVNCVALPDETPQDEVILTALASSDLEKRLIGLFLRFRDAMASLRSVIIFTSMADSAMRGATIQTRLIPFAQKHLTRIEDTDYFKLFSCPKSQRLALTRELRNYNDISTGFSKLPSAVLLSLVATFDSYFAEIVKFFLAMYPNRNATSRTVTLSELLSAESIESVISNILDEEIQSLMRGNHREQVEYIEKALNVKIINEYKHWGDFVEIFERRNLAAHGKLIVNDIYLSNCKSANCLSVNDINIGDALDAGVGYLNDSIDTLTEFGSMLLFVLWLKHVPQSRESAFMQLNEYSVELIKASRFQLAQRLLEFGLDTRKPPSDRFLKMMTINLANAVKKLGDMARCEQILNGTDWSASGDEFKLCIASLRDDIKAVVGLLPRVQASGGVSALSFRDWPVLDWVRTNPQVAEAFEKVYGEPMDTSVEPGGFATSQSAEVPPLEAATPAV